MYYNAKLHQNHVHSGVIDPPYLTVTLESRTSQLSGRCSCNLHKSCAGLNILNLRAEQQHLPSERCATVCEAFSSGLKTRRLDAKLQSVQRGLVCSFSILVGCFDFLLSPLKRNYATSRARVCVCVCVWRKTVQHVNPSTCTTTKQMATLNSCSHIPFFSQLNLWFKLSSSWPQLF